jgi:protein MpaA
VTVGRSLAVPSPQTNLVLARLVSAAAVSVIALCAAAEPARFPPGPPASTANKISPATAPSLGDLPAWCAAIVQVHAAIGEERCRESRLQATGGRSVRGTPLWSVDVAPEAAGLPLRVLVLGGIHADEVASVSLVFDWIERSQREANPRVHWRMTPLVNPDGFLRSPPTRVNARGVDLNRNFATDDWHARARTYWVGKTRRDPRRYPGPRPLSEPEAQWVHHQIERFAPDLIVAVHAPYGVLDFDGPPPPPSRLGSLLLDQVGVFPGSLGNYGGLVLGVPVVTLELTNAGKIPERESAAMWADLQSWINRRMLRLADSGAADSARGHR